MAFNWGTNLQGSPGCSMAGTSSGIHHCRSRLSREVGRPCDRCGGVGDPSWAAVSMEWIVTGIFKLRAVEH